MRIYDYDVARISDQGDRDRNQDRTLIIAHGGDLLLAVADGLGGHPRGEVAAQLFVDACERLFREQPKPITDSLDFFRRCVERAHNAVVRFGDSQRPPITPMTTMVMCLVQDQFVTWSHLGDSRLYLVRDGIVIDRTTDHCQTIASRNSQHGAAVARTVVTRCIGSRNNAVELEFSEASLMSATDRLLLCSDGLWSQVCEEEVLAVLSSDQDVGDTLKQLSQRAASLGRPRSDNITAIVLKPVNIDNTSP